MRRRRSTRNPCAARTEQCSPRMVRHATTYAGLVEAYICNYRGEADRDLSFFRQCSSLRRTIHFAALSKLPNGKRHPHQYRLPVTVLAEGERNLQACAAEIEGCLSFEALHGIVERELLCIHGIGVLTVYDVATRIGAYLGREPERVYLHAGTAAGARAIGLEHRRRSLDPGELPAPFQRLRPREIEDCLCLYKRQLARMRS